MPSVRLLLATFERVFAVEPARAVALVGMLTPREREVTRLVALGHNSESIGRRLRISVKTVRVHRNHVRAKLRSAGPADVARLWLLAELMRVLGPGSRGNRH